MKNESNRARCITQASELHGKCIQELEQELETTYVARIALRKQLITGQFKQFHLLGQNQRQIARIKTILTLKKREQL